MANDEWRRQDADGVPKRQAKALVNPGSLGMCCPWTGLFDIERGIVSRVLRRNDVFVGEPK
jgi:hypothetical protein